MQLYVTEQGSRINKSGGHLLIQNDGGVVSDVLLSDVESLSLFGAVHATNEAMLALLEKGTDIAFLSMGGRYRGRLTSGLGKNVELRLSQYDAYRNPARSFALAKTCVTRKLENGLYVLDAYHRNTHNSFHFDERDSYLKNLDAAREYEGLDRDRLRGFEGLGARTYFKCFARCLEAGVEFPGRKYRPCKDPVNALLSFGYALVTRTFASLIENAGLDPMVGYLHDVSYGRNSLACDMVEEFRHPFVDRLVLMVFNKGMLGAEDFEARDDGDGDAQVCMKSESMRKFLRYYEEFCNAPNHVYSKIGNLPWRKVMQIRVDEFRHTLQGGYAASELVLDQSFKESA